MPKPTHTPAKPGRPARISREQVLHTALVIVDRGGLEALTMRAVAEELDVEAMSLYRHVEHKADLVTGLVELVWSEVEIPDPATQDWKGYTRAVLGSLYATVLRHPHLAEVLGGRTPGLAGMRIVAAGVAKFAEAGFEGERLHRAAHLLEIYGLGYAVLEAGRRRHQDGEDGSPPGFPHADPGSDFLTVWPENVSPRLAAVLPHFLHCDAAAEFQFGLDVILSGIERELLPTERSSD